MPIRRVKKLISSVHKQGLRATSKEVSAFVQRHYWNYRENRIDRIHGTNTGGNEWDYLKNMSSTSLKDAEFYEPIKRSHFESMIEQANIDFKNNIFIDLGAGKGRALMFAADYPFKQIIGVEFSQILYDMMHQNIDTYLEKTRKENNFLLSCGDAVDFELPQSDLTIYLFNPFVGNVMQRVVEKICNFIQHTDFQVKILYRNPSCYKMFQHGYLQLDVESPLYNLYSGKKSSHEKSHVEPHVN